VLRQTNQVCACTLSYPFPYNIQFNIIGQIRPRHTEWPLAFSFSDWDFVLCFSYLVYAYYISLLYHTLFVHPNNSWCRSPRPRGLRCRFAAARLLEMRVRIPTEAWMCVSYWCCVLTGRGLCVGLIIRPRKSYWVLCVKLSVKMKPWWGSNGSLGVAVPLKTIFDKEQKLWIPH